LNLEATHSAKDVLTNTYNDNMTKLSCKASDASLATIAEAAADKAIAEAPKYPPFLQKLLDECPRRPDNGIHPWLFKVARYLHYFHSPEEIYGILKARVAGCGRAVEEREITDAIKNSGDVAWNPKMTASERRAEWLECPVDRVEFDPELAVQTAERVPIDITPDWLKERSVVATSCSTEAYLESVFQAGERVLYFNRYKRQGAGLWTGGVSLGKFTRMRWKEGAWFLSNPVDGKFHWNPRTGGQSRRSQESVTSFRYAVLECDQKPKEKWFPVWLKILVQLPLPIVSITDSAGKSAHALVRVSCDTKEAWDKEKCKILRPLITLGADDGALSAVRLTRLPNCYRGDRLQELLYLNPDADWRPIYE
jgi:hypothetical protein